MTFKKHHLPPFFLELNVQRRQASNNNNKVVVVLLCRRASPYPTTSTSTTTLSLRTGVMQHPHARSSQKHAGPGAGGGPACQPVSQASRGAPGRGSLTIVPRLYRLNQEPGVSLGHFAILLCKQIRPERAFRAGEGTGDSGESGLPVSHVCIH